MRKRPYILPNKVCMSFFLIRNIDNITTIFNLENYYFHEYSSKNELSKIRVKLIYILKYYEPPMSIKSLNYKNGILNVSKNINIFTGGNGTGKTIFFNELYNVLQNRINHSNIVTDLKFYGLQNEMKVFYFKQNDLIVQKKQIIELIKKYTDYDLIKSNIDESILNLQIEDKDDHMFQLKRLNIKVQSNLQKYQEHKKLIQEKEKIEYYIKSKESKKLCDRIIEIQDKISKEEIEMDNFENDVAIMKKEKLEKEIENLNFQITNEHNLLERKKILWREELRLKEEIKKYRDGRRVIDLIEFDTEISNAVIAVLGNKLKARVVQYEDEALDEIKNLKYRQTFLVMDKIDYVDSEEEKIQKEMIPLKKLIKTKAEYNRLREFLFRDIILVKNFNYEVPNKMLVTLNGQVLHKNGAITGGYDENKELKEMISDKEIYKKRIKRLKEIEKEIRKINEASVNDAKNLVLKIIEGKQEELKQIKISRTNLNFNLEKLKILLNRLIEQKKSIKGITSEFKFDQNLEAKNLNEELGKINKEMREIMINRRIDYEDIAEKIENLLKKDKELQESKIKMEQIAKELEQENEKAITENLQKTSEKILFYYRAINGEEFQEGEISSDEIRSSSGESKRILKIFWQKHTKLKSQIH